MSKYTPWLDPVKHPPVRVGWYPVDDAGPYEARRHWNGVWWSIGTWLGEPDFAEKDAGLARAPLQTGFKYRGLTAPHPEYKA